MGLGLSMRNGFGACASAGGYLRKRGSSHVGRSRRLTMFTSGCAQPSRSARCDTVSQMIGPAMVGLMVAGVAAGVLASGDALFASYLDLEVALTSIGARFFAASVVVAIVAVSTGAAIALGVTPPSAFHVALVFEECDRRGGPACAVYVVYVIVHVLVAGARRRLCPRPDGIDVRRGSPDRGSSSWSPWRW